MKIRSGTWLAATIVALEVAACSGAGLPTFSAAPTVPTASAAPTVEPTADEPTDTPGAIPDNSANPPPSAGGEIDFAQLATGETPDGWVEDLSNDGACRQAVPADWITGGIQGIADSPDFHVQSLLANDGVLDFDAEIEHLKATYFTPLSSSDKVVLLEDDHLFLMRETAHGGGSYVISLNSDTTACGIIVTVDEVAVDQYRGTVVQILYTLAETGASPSP
jgi:hypothetical protein